MEKDNVFDVPVLLIMFNRPGQALQVFERIRDIKPSKIFLAVDGPRENHLADKESVQKCRQIKNYVDWPCAVYTLFRDKNLGCKRAVSQAIDWLFEHEETGIILEDDCLPELSFFEYCRLLLNKYADNTEVMHIGGSNLYGHLKWGEDSFFFTSIPHVWGWATWRRAWLKYSISMDGYYAFEKSGNIDKIVTNKKSSLFWKKSFSSLIAGELDTWDYQWVFTIWKNGGLCITPNQNLITNIGFNSEATHTKSDSVWSNLPTVSIDTGSMIYPKDILINNGATEYAFSKFYQLPSWWVRKYQGLKRLLLS